MITKSCKPFVEWSDRSLKKLLITVIMTKVKKNLYLVNKLFIKGSQKIDGLLDGSWSLCKDSFYLYLIRDDLQYQNTYL